MRDLRETFHHRFHTLMDQYIATGTSEFEAQSLALMQIQAEVRKGADYSFSLS